MIKRALLYAASALAALFIAFAPALPAAAQGYGLPETKKTIETGSERVQLVTSPTQVIGNIVKAALGLVSVIFFVLMIYAGFLWMTARGNEKMVAQARDIIIAAIIGMVVIVMAYAITNAVISGVTTGDTSESGTTDTSTSNQ